MFKPAHLSKINKPHELCWLRFSLHFTIQLPYVFLPATSLPPLPYRLSRHLITVSLGDTNSTLMFPFVRVSCQSPPRANNYRQLFLLIIFLTLAGKLVYPSHKDPTLGRGNMPDRQSISVDVTYVSIKKMCNVNSHVFCSSK